MKNRLNQLALKAVRTPVLGKLLLIALAIYQLPDIRQKVLYPSGNQSPDLRDGMVQEPNSLGEFARINRVLNEQKKINEIQLASIPDALRIHERKLRGLEGQHELLKAAFQLQAERFEFVRYEVLLEARYRANGSVNRSSDFEAGSRTDISKFKKPVKLNLGAGHKPEAGYVNTDMRDLPGIDLVCAINDLPFEDSTVEEIKSSHVMEHFPIEQLKREILPHIKRKLIEGGVFRTIAPNIPAMIESYSQGEIDYAWLSKVIYGGQEYEGDYHFSGLSVQVMSKLLEDAGFRDINIIEEKRMNSGCLEFEIVASK